MKVVDVKTTEVHSESSHASKTELLVKIVNDWNLLTFLIKSSTLDVIVGSGYAPEWNFELLITFLFLVNLKRTSLGLVLLS